MTSSDARPPASTPTTRRVHEPSGRTPEALTVTTVSDGRSVVIAVYGEIDLGSVEAFEAAAQSALDTDAPQVVVDLGACHFIDSTGLGAMVNLHRRVQSREGSELMILPGPRAVQRAFAISGLDDVLPFPDADLAGERPAVERPPAT